MPLGRDIVGWRLAEDLRQLLNTELTLGGIDLSADVRVVMVVARVPASFEGRAGCQGVCVGFHYFCLLPRCGQADQGVAILQGSCVFLMQPHGWEGQRAWWWHVHGRKPLVEFLWGAFCKRAKRSDKMEDTQPLPGPKRSDRHEGSPSVRRDDFSPSPPSDILGGSSP